MRTEHKHCVGPHRVVTPAPPTKKDTLTVQVKY